jgi:hypothetical protein
MAKGSALLELARAPPGVRSPDVAVSNKTLENRGDGDGKKNETGKLSAATTTPASDNPKERAARQEWRDFLTAAAATAVARQAGARSGAAGSDAGHLSSSSSTLASFTHQAEFYPKAKYIFQQP